MERGEKFPCQAESHHFRRLTACSAALHRDTTNGDQSLLPFKMPACVPGAFHLVVKDAVLTDSGRDHFLSCRQMPCAIPHDFGIQAKKRPLFINRFNSRFMESRHFLACQLHEVLVCRKYLAARIAILTCIKLADNRRMGIWTRTWPLFGRR